MTSASELFYTRRCRYGRHVSSLDLGLDSPPEDRSFHHHATGRRSRRDTIAGCDHPPRRRSSALPAHQPQQQPQHRHPPYLERDTVRIGEGSGQSLLSNSRINLGNFGVVGNRGSRDIGNDRLPGTVLLARERLLERLRNVSLSGNRRNNRPSSRSNRNGLTDGDDHEVVDVTGNYWDTETSRESLPRDLLFADSAVQIDQLLGIQATRSNRRHPGLTDDALDRLQLEVFTESHSCGDGEVIILGASQECSICLEGFAEGDNLTRLPCAHRFHSVCLNPWVQTCGDCPYCRSEIVVSSN